MLTAARSGGYPQGLKPSHDTEHARELLNQVGGWPQLDHYDSSAV